MHDVGVRSARRIGWRSGRMYTIGRRAVDGTPGPPSYPPRFGFVARMTSLKPQHVARF